jgi:hypothetical protein
MLLGDLNARAASQTSSANDHVQISKDDGRGSPRGRFLFQLCQDYDLELISGADCFGPASSEYTSFQGSMSTVIDYAIFSRSLFPRIHAFGVEPRIVTPY